MIVVERLLNSWKSLLVIIELRIVYVKALAKQQRRRGKKRESRKKSDQVRSIENEM